MQKFTPTLQHSILTRGPNLISTVVILGVSMIQEQIGWTTNQIFIKNKRSIYNFEVRFKNNQSLFSYSIEECKARLRFALS
jgi:hypothetical protein